MKYKQLGIDLGIHTIKIVILKHISGVFGVEHGQVYTVPKNINIKSYYKFVEKCISRFTKKNKITLASLNFSLPIESPYVEVAIFNLPIVNEKVLKKSIQYEIEERNLLSNMDLSTYHYKVVDIDESNKTQRVVVESVSDECLLRLSKINKANWKTNSIELQVFTAGRIVKGNSIVLDFGEQSTRIYMYQDGKPFHVSSVPIGGIHFTNKIKEIYPNLQNEEIEDIKEKCYIYNEFVNTDNDLSDACKEITEVANELSAAIKMRIRSVEIQDNFFTENIYFTGELAKLSYLTELISKDLDMLISPLTIINEKTENDQSIYTMAGLASIQKDYPYYNELGFSKDTNIGVDASTVLIFIACVTASVMIALFGGHKIYDDKINNLSYLESSQTSTLMSIDSKIDSANALIQQSKDVINDIEQLEDTKFWTSDVLYALPEISSEEISIEHIDLRDEKAILTGYSSDASNIAFLTKRLEEFGTVTFEVQNSIEEDIVLVSDELEGKLSFEITISYFNRPFERYLSLADNETINDNSEGNEEEKDSKDSKDNEENKDESNNEKDNNSKDNTIKNDDDFPATGTELGGDFIGNPQEIIIGGDNYN